METPDLGNAKKENHSPFKVEHLPGVDVVINLDYPIAEDSKAILGFLRDNITIGEQRALLITLKGLKELKRESGEQRFHVKAKTGYPQKHVDFILGRTMEDPINPSVAHDFNTKARYAYVGILNEIILSKKIRELVALPKFQQLAHKHGFADFMFSEPILAIVDRKSARKYLVYKKEKENYSFKDLLTLEKVARDLRELFLIHGIYPCDLKWNQFMIVEQKGRKCLVLIDTEAYTEVEPQG